MAMSTLATRMAMILLMWMTFGHIQESKFRAGTSESLVVKVSIHLLSQTDAPIRQKGQ